MRARPEAVAFAAVAVLSAAYAASGLYVVGPDERAVLTRFGAVVGEAPPGVHYHAPWPFGAATVPRVAVDEANAAGDGTRVARELLTGDRCVVECLIALRYEVVEPGAAVGAARDLHALARGAAEAAMAAAVARSVFAEVTGAGASRIESEATAATQAALDAAGAGVQIVSVTLASVTLPDPAGRADARADSASDRAAAAVGAAREHRSSLSELARGESAALLSAARSYQDRVARDAVRESARFATLLAEYRQAPEETRARLRRETLADVLSEVRCLKAAEVEGEADAPGSSAERQP